MPRPRKLDRPVVISFAVSSSLRDRLRSVAQESGVKVSELLRRYVERSLADTSPRGPPSEGMAQPRVKAAEMLKFEWLESAVARLRATIEEIHDPSYLEDKAKQLYEECLAHLKSNPYLSDKEVEDLSKSLRDVLTAISSKGEEGTSLEELA